MPDWRPNTPTAEAPACTATTTSHRRRPAATNWKAPTSTSSWCCILPEQANAFFSTSSQRWPACANRQDTVPADGTHPELQWKVRQVSNANGVLSTSVIVTVNGDGTNVTMPCQRALTARRNVVIDVDVCRKDVGDLGVNIANQIAAKVDKQ